MSYNHQPQLSVNSIQSLVEPITPPPIGQMNNKKNHQKTQSLDLSGFNQFISSSATNYTQSPLIYYNSNISPNSYNSNNLPLINEFATTTTTLKDSQNLIQNNSTINNTKNNNNGRLNENNDKHPKHNSKGKDNNNYNKNNNNNKNRYNNSNNNSNANSSAALSTAINEINSTSLEELDYVKLATDQFGCRFLQKKLESNSKAESNLVRDLMFEQIKPYFINLLLDPFGNYLIQKVCEYLTVDQKTFLINSIYPHVFKISINQYGTRSLQKIIDTVDNEAQIDLIVKGFSPSYTSIAQIVILINDLNGNHVIQKCIFKFPSSKFDFIINAITEKNNIVTISTHKHGCCVLQKLLSVCSLQQIFKISIKIIQFLSGLINDQFGNYIIQFLLDIRELDFYFLIEVFNKLSSDLCELSCLKFSSNVIEKFIKKLFGVVVSAIKGETLPNINDDTMNNIINILLTIIDIFNMKLNILIRDNFGNYALQTLLDVKNYSIMLQYNGNDYIANNNPKFLSFSNDFTEKIDTLVHSTKDYLPSIKTTSYAKKIKLKVKGYSELCGVDLNDTTSSSNPTSSSSHSKNTTINYDSKNQKKQKHQRHVSLPANAYHRRNSSSVLTANSAFLPLQKQPQQQSQQLGNLQTSMTAIFNSQNSSPLSINQSQQTELMNISNMFPAATNNLLSTQNGLNFSDNFDLTRPLANLTLNSNASAQPSFFMNDFSSKNSNNNNNAISSGSSSSNLFQNNSYSSTSSSTLNGTIPNNSFMTNPNLMNTSNIASNSNDRKNSSSFSDFKNSSFQPQQRIISSPFPNVTGSTFNSMNNTGTTYPNNVQMYLNNTNNNTLIRNMNVIPNSSADNDFTKPFGYY